MMRSEATLYFSLSSMFLTMSRVGFGGATVERPQKATSWMPFVVRMGPTTPPGPVSFSAALILSGSLSTGAWMVLDRCTL